MTALTRDIPEELLMFVRALVTENGTKAAAERLQVGRATVYRLLAEKRAMLGTIALLEQAFAKRPRRTLATPLRKGAHHGA